MEIKEKEKESSVPKSATDLFAEKAKLKKGHEPWPKEEVARMQLGINQIVHKTLKAEQELMRVTAGLDEMDKEIMSNIDQQALVVKAAKLNLADLLFDQKNEITIKKHKNRVAELQQEIALNNHNVNAHQLMLDGGRPKKKELEPKEEEPVVAGGGKKT